MAHIIGTGIKTYQNATRVSLLYGEVEQIKSQNNTLRGNIEEGREQAYIEEIARNKLNMIRKDENLVVVLDEVEIPADQSKLVNIVKNKTTLEQWGIFIFGRS